MTDSPIMNIEYGALISNKSPLLESHFFVYIPIAFITSANVGLILSPFASSPRNLVGVPPPIAFSLISCFSAIFSHI